MRGKEGANEKAVKLAEREMIWPSATPSGTRIRTLLSLVTFLGIVTLGSSNEGEMQAAMTDGDVSGKELSGRISTQEVEIIPGFIKTGRLVSHEFEQVLQTSSQVPSPTPAQPEECEVCSAEGVHNELLGDRGTCREVEHDHPSDTLAMDMHAAKSEGD